MYGEAVDASEITADDHFENSEILKGDSDSIIDEELLIKLVKEKLDIYKKDSKLKCVATVKSLIEASIDKYSGFIESLFQKKLIQLRTS